MSSNERSIPMLAVRFSRSGRFAATALSSKGVTRFGVENFARFIEETGIKRFINFSDNEPSILALTDAAARSLPFVE